MKDNIREIITVEVEIKAPVDKVWNYWNMPDHIKNWNQASVDWHTPYAENDLRPGGNFLYRMEAKDKSFGFDFSGVYDMVNEHEYIEYRLGDERKVKITFTSIGNATRITESFEAESLNSAELQRNGWQSILDSFRVYVEETN